MIDRHINLLRITNIELRKIVKPNNYKKKSLLQIVCLKNFFTQHSKTIIKIYNSLPFIHDGYNRVMFINRCYKQIIYSKVYNSNNIFFKK